MLWKNRELRLKTESRKSENTVRNGMSGDPVRCPQCGQNWASGSSGDPQFLQYPSWCIEVAPESNERVRLKNQMDFLVRKNFRDQSNDWLA